MKKFYYFSSSKIQSVEIGNIRLKFLSLVSVIFAISLLLVSGGFYFYITILNPPKDLAALRSENRFLKSKIETLASYYSQLDKELDSLNFKNRSLRSAVNLPQVDTDSKSLPVGGTSFGSIFDALQNSDNDLNNQIRFIDDVIARFEREKSSTDEIQRMLSINQRLFKCLPAIKPTSGELTEHGFGMRKHPILGIYRMHEGIDIITDVGTEVVATGDGIVDFVGTKGGLGIAVEIDHGFGYRTIYGHLSKTKVREGQKISRGDVIALSGNTGLSSGPHLHYEVLHNGINLDPEGFFFDNLNLFNTNTITKKE